jgi:hypothetical protein
MAGVEDDLVINQDNAIDTTPEEAIEFQARTEVNFPLVKQSGTGLSMNTIRTSVFADAAKLKISKIIYLDSLEFDLCAH